MKKRFVLCLAIAALLVVPTMSVAAAGEIQPIDPGAGSSQDASIKGTLEWMIQLPPALNSPIVNLAETINSASLDAIALSTGSYGYLPFAGFDALHTGMNGSGGVVLSGFSGGIGGVKACIPPSAQCTSSKDPGDIVLTATKNSPTNVVVVSQDPNHSGVSLTWKLTIYPDVYTYGIWTAMPFPDPGNCIHENATCTSSGQACCPGYKCVKGSGSHPSSTCQRDPTQFPPYECVDHYEIWDENVSTLTAVASLTTGSRSWILNDLNRVYPGASLKHPDWSFKVNEKCVWNDDICNLTHNEGSVQVVDPGHYDLMITGKTVGSYITPARDFTLTSGQFGVNLVESSLTGQP